MSWVKKAWRWLTLSGLEVQHPVQGYCDFCEERALVLVYVNEKSWNTCVAHSGKPFPRRNRKEEDHDMDLDA